MDPKTKQAHATIQELRAQGADGLAAAVERAAAPKHTHSQEFAHLVQDAAGYRAVVEEIEDEITETSRGGCGCEEGAVCEIHRLLNIIEHARFVGRIPYRKYRKPDPTPGGDAA